MTEMVYRSGAVSTDETEFPNWWRTVDKVSLTCVLSLFFVGLLLCMAASPPLAESNGKEPFYYVKRQAFFGLIAFMIMIVLSLLSVVENRRVAIIAFIVTFVAILLLPIAGTDHGKGAVRWLSVLGLSIQPSEFLKPFFVVFMAWLMSASSDKFGPPGKSLAFLILLIVIGFLVIQPDFGQAGLLLAVWSIMYFVAGAPIVFICSILIGTSIFSVLAYNNSDHFARRIDGFLAPEIDPRTQIGYATNAIQEGGIFGVGVGEGKVKWRLPDAHTDFIISVAAEEFGLLLCALIMILYLIIIIRSIMRLMKENNFFIQICGTGIIALLAMQAIINLGVAVRLLPAKGMTLPFISYGGSSILALGFLMGILFSLTRRRPQNDFSLMVD